MKKSVLLGIKNSSKDVGDAGIKEDDGEAPDRPEYLNQIAKRFGLEKLDPQYSYAWGENGLLFSKDNMTWSLLRPGKPKEKIN